MYLAYNFTTVTEILVDHLKRIVNTKNRKILHVLTEIVIFTNRRRHNKKKFILFIRNYHDKHKTLFKNNYFTIRNNESDES